jgi:C_GCAxxG_C_C family probable redox protein
MGGLRPLDQSELYRQAEALHQTYAAAELNCAERVFLIMHRLLETDIPAEAVCLMTGFGGGVGGARDNVCGAITGGVAAIGLAHGRQNPPEGNRERAYEISRDFVGRFRAAFGTTVCGDLVGDLTRQATPEADKERKARCARFTLSAVKACIDTLRKYDRFHA